MASFLLTYNREKNVQKGSSLLKNFFGERLRLQLGQLQVCGKNAVLVLLIILAVLFLSHCPVNNIVPQINADAADLICVICVICVICG